MTHHCNLAPRVSGAAAGRGVRSPFLHTAVLGFHIWRCRNLFTGI